MKRLAAVACVLAITEGAFAQVTDNRAIECGSSATYFPRGDVWPVEPGASDVVPLVYSQHSGGIATIPGDAELGGVAYAFDLWSTTQCANNFYPNVAMAEGAEHPTRDAGTVGDSIVYFEQNAATFPGDPEGTVAATVVYAFPSTGHIVSADMALNNIAFDFRTAATGSSVGCSLATSSNCYLLEAIVSHEVGHFLGFGHVMCTDALMYPERPPNTDLVDLSVHERTGLCTVYAPRPQGATRRTFGERCATTGDCETDLFCVLSTELQTGTDYGYCSKTCSSDSNCQTGFVCDVVEGTSINFCKPGLKPDENPGYVDPGTGRSVDYCAPCTSGAQCSNGACVGDGSGENLCTSFCSGATGCPSGFSCVASNQSFNVCWPDNPATCGGDDNRANLGDQCWQGAAVGSGGDFTAVCKPGLVCFEFQPKCGGSVGSCVATCDAYNKPYDGAQCPNPNQRCCYGTDATGLCLGPSEGREIGGCFTPRLVGESCVSAENSFCEPGSGCFYTNATVALCIRRCDQGAACAAGEECRVYGDACSNEYGLCCDTTVKDTCLPKANVSLLDVGVECTTGPECHSGVCYSLDGDAACSQQCNAVTNTGCPGDEADVNGDGVPDGGFTCRYVDGRGWCWPKRGPRPPPKNYVGPPVDECTEGCCCSAAVTPRPGDWLLWAGLLGLAWRRRRRGT